MSTLLFIDDHIRGSRKLIQKLRAARYEVCVAVDVDEAIRLFRLYVVDAVVLDCRVFRLSNTPEHPAAVLRRLQPNALIIMMSSYCSVPCTWMPYADACIQKGDTTANLLRTIEIMLCARHYGLCRSIAS